MVIFSPFTPSPLLYCSFPLTLIVLSFVSPFLVYMYMLVGFLTVYFVVFLLDRYLVLPAYVNVTFKSSYVVIVWFIVKYPYPLVVAVYVLSFTLIVIFSPFTPSPLLYCSFPLTLILEYVYFICCF